MDELDFARRIHNWILKGFTELGDSEGIVLSETVKQVLHLISFYTPTMKKELGHVFFSLRSHPSIYMCVHPLWIEHIFHNHKNIDLPKV